MAKSYTGRIAVEVSDEAV